MAGEEKNTQPRAAAGPPRAPRVAPKPQSPAAPGTVARRRAQPLPGPSPRRGSPPCAQGPGAGVRWGVQTPGVLKQPQDPRGAAWGPTPGSAGARACPCHLWGQRRTPRGSPPGCCLSFPIALPLPGLWGRCGRTAMTTERTSGRWARSQPPAQPQPRHACARFPSWQRTPWPGHVPGARRHRGAAGAALAAGFGMSQREPEPGWHPVFNQAAGGRWRHLGEAEGRVLPAPLPGQANPRARCWRLPSARQEGIARSAGWQCQAEPLGLVPLLPLHQLCHRRQQMPSRSLVPARAKRASHCSAAPG